MSGPRLPSTPVVDSNDTLNTGEVRPGVQTTEPAATPRLEILHHPDLMRVGESTGPGAFAGAALVLGRQSPSFVAAGDEGPLADPFISREQCTLRWLSGPRLFELTPGAAARRQLALLAPDARALVPVTGRLHAAPGSVLAIGERVLLLLTCSPRRPAEVDRLGMLGESQAMWRVREQIGVLARFSEGVLVLGETGAGKELVAQAIHRLSRAPGPFVAINMGAIEAGTAGSALFGHVRGAFSGADRDVVGACERARRGTLFLDEIGDLALDLQKTLLRVLEERRFTPVGGSSSHELQCRVVAATHCPLLADVAAGRFRRDLHERLGALTLAVPPLRQRREDIPRLFVRFLVQQVAEHPDLTWLLSGPDAHGAPPVPLAFVAGLLTRPWPGNVRELRNLVTAVAAANFGQRRFVAPTSASAPVSADPPAPTRRAPIAVPTAEALEAALAATHGNVSAAAAALGGSRFQFYRWAHARGVDLERRRG